MYGYIYVTTNLINGRVYIGKHKSDKYDSGYLGSGKILKQAIKLYGKQNFSNELLYAACSLNELNEAEKQYIKIYKEKYGDLCYNIANGGDGGDIFSELSEKEKQFFVQKMCKINKERCNSEDFKKKASDNMHKRYLDEKERKKQSQKIRAYWTEENRIAHGEILKESYKTHPRECVWNYKPCVLIINDNRYNFKSLKDLLAFLKQNYNYGPSRYTINKIVEDSKNNISFSPFHKKKYGNIKSLMIFVENNKSVETNEDEFTQ